jgi:cell division protein FtsB
MSLMRELRRRLAAAIIPVFGACAIGYFGYHAMEGERGLQAYYRTQAAIAEAKSVLAETTAERRRLERRVALLRPDGLDVDMLDEQARGSLGLARADEIIIYKQMAAKPAN